MFYFVVVVAVVAVVVAVVVVAVVGTIAVPVIRSLRAARDPFFTFRFQDTITDYTIIQLCIQFTILMSIIQFMQTCAFYTSVFVNGSIKFHSVLLSKIPL